jgi:hypothetical protein
MVDFLKTPLPVRRLSQALLAPAFLELIIRRVANPVKPVRHLCAT